MLLNLVYGVLEAISKAIYTTVATIWSIEQAMINMMMSTFLFVLGIACHPVMVIPMLLGGYYIIRNFCFRRAMNPKKDNALDNDGGLIKRNIPLSPRLPSYRSFGNLSSLSNDVPNDNCQ
ncbi:uncharacterized protein LOC108109097 [Drosophila eugracilis]|uniref:uncharacterized protein LOC108109097 n=1 Tax=Drosophila eugracilis TaxID=29029 RepID=UPI0007E819F2|nr:uncharacterized protein LOC108109097 [Drosophila eugracilis]